jgi:hypothetical protein
MRLARALVGIAALAAVSAACQRSATATADILWLVQNTEVQPRLAPARPTHELNTLKDIYDAVRRCYRPPSLDQAFPGMRITVQFAYTRAGGLFGKPRILFETAGISPQHQSAYRAAVAEALVRCAHLPFSESLGSAVAGRILAIQFIDERNLKRAEYTSWPSPKTR